MDSSEAPVRVCVFRLGGVRLGVDARQVQEVLRPQPITPVPFADRQVLGLVNLRGQILLAFDLRCRLGLPPADPKVKPLQVVCLQGGEAVSFLVDSLEEVQEISPGDRHEIPDNLPGQLREALIGVWDAAGGLLLVLDPLRLLGDNRHRRSHEGAGALGSLTD